MKPGRFLGSRKWTTVIVPILILAVMPLVYIYDYEESYGVFEWAPAVPRNYFQSTLNLPQGKFLVKTDKCQIPDINPWSPELQALVKPLKPLECNKINLTYVDGRDLIINISKIPEMGYKPDDILCCYHIVHRVEQTEQDFDEYADKKYRLSEKCYPMEPETRPIHGYIQVVCSVKYLFMDVAVYTNFHLLAVFPKEDKALQAKLSYWKDCYHSAKTKTKTILPKCTDRPPNVLIIGIDSTSRLNFHRFMEKSKDVLEKELSAIEMNGYTKVGENTFPNYVPLMSSFSEDELFTVCYHPSKPQDKCPYIWRKFSDLNYLTAHLEDKPKFQNFQYYKIGFIRKPVDMYIRPWMLAAYDNMDQEDCIGYQRPDEVILNYILDLITLSESRKIPYLITSWLTHLTRKDMSDIQRMDLLLENILRKLYSKGYLNNTLLLVMSDHGYRYGNARQTMAGWFEDKLPVLYIKLPDAVAKEQPAWIEGLKYNSKQLSTPFDVHSSLKDILHQAYLKTSGVPMKENTARYNLTIHPLRGLSLFRFLPPRTCEEAGVPKEYCACSSLTPFTGNYSLIELGAQEIVKSINAKLPPACMSFDVGRITASGIFNGLQNEVNNSTSKIYYTIGLETKPGKFAFEGVIMYDPKNGHFGNVTNIVRTNEKLRKSWCLNYKEGEGVFELFCYCR